MPVYFYWGEDEFALERAVKSLRKKVLDPTWASFNYTVLGPEQPDAIIAALNTAMTPPFGATLRLIWLVNPSLFQQNPAANVMVELERTMMVIPDSSVLLLTCDRKPDERLKATKLIKQYAKVQEFPLIPPWKTELLAQQVKQVAAELDVKLTAEAVYFLAEAVGNNTRNLYNELEKLKLHPQADRPLDTAQVSTLVTANAQTSLKLAETILTGNTSTVLSLATSLLNRNEPALKIVATLVNQFRTWLWIKVMSNAGVKDEREIASAAEIANPKRIYPLRQQLNGIYLEQLLASLPVLLQLELSLKQGMDDRLALQTHLIQLCQIYQSN